MAVFGPIFGNRQFRNLAVSQFCTIFSSNFMVPVLPVYMKTQGFSDTQIGIVMGATAVGALIVRPWAGLGVDTRGTRPIILAGQAMLILCLAGYWLLSGVLALTAVRFIHGMSVAFYGTGAVTFASCVETPENTTAAIALYSVFTMLGMGLATSTGPMLYDAAGFGAVLAGSLVFVGVATVVMGIRSVSFRVGGTAEERKPFAAVLRSGEVAGPSVALFASNFALSTATTFVPLVALASGISWYSAFYVAFAVAVVAARLAVQFVTARWTPVQAATGAGLLNALGVFLLAVYPSVITFAVSGVLLGFGFGTIFPALAAYLVANTSPANKGMALGILTGAGDVGNAVGAAVLGAVADAFGYSVLFYAATAVVLLCGRYFQVMQARAAGGPRPQS